MRAGAFLRDGSSPGVKLYASLLALVSRRCWCNVVREVFLCAAKHGGGISFATSLGVGADNGADNGVRGVHREDITQSVQ